MQTMEIARRCAQLDVVKDACGAYVLSLHQGGLGPEERMDEQELRQELAKAIDGLNEQERTVLSLYYYENLTMREIGQVMGVSEQHIGQINRKLIRKLRDRMTDYMKG